MEYRAVGNRCAINPSLLKLKISNQEVLAILTKKGFRVLEIDLIALARQRINVSQYRRSARLSEAPAAVDCSSFIKWLYGKYGIWLPRRSIQQRELGIPVSLSEIARGDVIFVSGWIDYYYDDPSDGVGHVGIATGEGTVIHAANKNVGVVENSVESFIGKKGFRGIRRYIPKDQIVFTLETPAEREIETADDVKWVILQSL